MNENVFRFIHIYFIPSDFHSIEKMQISNLYNFLFPWRTSFSFLLANLVVTNYLSFNMKGYLFSSEFTFPGYRILGCQVFLLVFKDIIVFFLAYFMVMKSSTLPLFLYILHVYIMPLSHWQISRIFSLSLVFWALIIMCLCVVCFFFALNNQ